MRIVAIIQARMGSTRLPGKILAPVVGEPLLSVLVKRVMTSCKVDEWWLATSDDGSDDVTASWGEALGLSVFRGDMDDVLSRFVGTLAEAGVSAGWFLRLTADDPFADGDIVDALVEQALRADETVDLIGELPEERLLPLGYTPQIARIERVLELPGIVTDTSSPHRSHVLSWFLEADAARQFQPPPAWPHRPHWRWTVDTRADLTMADAAFRLFGVEWSQIRYEEMVRALDDRADIVSMNAQVRQKAISEG